MKNINIRKLVAKTSASLVLQSIAIVYCTLYLISLADAQSLPKPLYHFPLDFKNPSEWSNYTSRGAILTHQGIHGGTFITHQDRFGIKDGAIKFPSGNSYISLGADIPQIPAGTDVTVSFWVYMDATHTIPNSYDNSSGKYRFFTLSEDARSGGLARVASKALIGSERIATVNGTTKPWYLWLYEPVTMTQKGWYHIFMISAKNYTKVYMYKPDGSQACSYNYMGNDFAKKITIGKRFSYTGQDIRSGEVMDDFKVYNSALNEGQIHSLHSEDLKPITRRVRILNFRDQNYLYAVPKDDLHNACLINKAQGLTSKYSPLLNWILLPTTSSDKSEFMLFHEKSKRYLEFRKGYTPIDVNFPSGMPNQKWLITDTNSGNVRIETATQNDEFLVSDYRRDLNTEQGTYNPKNEWVIEVLEEYISPFVGGQFYMEPIAQAPKLLTFDDVINRIRIYPGSDTDTFKKDSDMYQKWNFEFVPDYLAYLIKIGNNQNFLINNDEYHARRSLPKDVLKLSNYEDPKTFYDPNFYWYVNKVGNDSYSIENSKTLKKISGEKRGPNISGHNIYVLENISGINEKWRLKDVKSGRYLRSFGDMFIFEIAKEIKDEIEGLSNDKSKNFTEKNEYSAEQIVNPKPAIYPNPSNGTLHVRINSAVKTNINFKLTNFHGRVLFEGSTQIQKGEQTIVLQNLKNNGVRTHSIYTLKGITTEGKLIVNEKVVFE